MRVVVPFGADRPKTRLGPVLDRTERETFASAMLRDVLAALRSLDREPTVLADAPLDADVDVGSDAPVTVDERPLTGAVNGVLPSSPDDEAVAVVMADLALATPAALARLFEAGAADGDADADVVLAPGRGGGTNALLVRDPSFRVDYHGASVRDHRRIAGEADLEVAEVDSYRLATDVDEPADLVEVLLHAPPGSAALAWLESAGFELAVSDGRASARRQSR